MNRDDSELLDKTQHLFSGTPFGVGATDLAMVNVASCLMFLR